MDQIFDWMMQWWRRQDDVQRRHASAIALCGLVYLIHYLIYCIPQPFFIEDAAISFSYARNLVDGEGLVAYAGGERVEGYSNALWTFLGALFYALGMPLWTSAKLMGAVFGVLTLPVVYALTRRMRPNAKSDVALLAPLALALHPSFVVWNASGLENSLFCLLLVGSSWRLIREAEDCALRPWSAVGFFLLSMTRPEGIMYVVLAFIAEILYCIADKRPMRALRWLAVFAVPFALYNGWRYWYFAWEFPNTYYAKLGVDRFHPYSWNAKGWKYIKNYLIKYGVVFGLPLLFFALGGAKDLWRRRTSVALILGLSVLVLWNGNLTRPPAWWPAPDSWPTAPDWLHRMHAEWVHVRVWSIAVVSAGLGVMTLTWDGWRTRGLLWCHCTAAVFFALYSGGDWMKEWRWFNIVSVTLLPLLCVGLGEVLDALVDDDWRIRVPRVRAPVPARWIFLTAVAVPFLGRGIQRGVGFAFSPETAVRDIYRRVLYMQDVQRQLDVDHITLLDVDMGAHLYHSGWDIVDIAGLVDVPMARHSDFNRKFILEYIFEERRPDFAHVHAGWARQSKIDRPRQWRQEYLEIPGYPLQGRQLHVGNHIRRDLFITPFERLPEQGVANFETEVQLLSVAIPSPEVAAGTSLHLLTTWRAQTRQDGFRALFWMDNGEGNRHVTAVEPGHGWYPPEEWKATEQVEGRFWIPIPEDLPQGAYRTGLVLLDESSGQVLSARGMSTDDVVYLEGELQLDTVVNIVSAQEARDLADADVFAALQNATTGECEAVWEHFKNATRHVDGDVDWRQSNEAKVREALALCFVDRASTLTERDDKIPVLQSARFWDHRAPGLAAAVAPVVEDLTVQGQAFAGQGDWEGAYQAWSTALSLRPTDAWTRRWAEDARDRRLGIHRPGSEPEPTPQPPAVPPVRREGPLSEDPPPDPPDKGKLPTLREIPPRPPIPQPTAPDGALPENAGPAVEPEPSVDPEDDAI